MIRSGFVREYPTEKNMIEILDRSSGAVLGFRMSGKLHDADYTKSSCQK